MPEAALPQALYHLNPFALGPLDTAPAEFGRIAALGFDAVCLASPFDAAPGQAGLLRDPSRLHEGLGGGEALPALARLAEAARGHGLALLLDVEAGRLSRQAPLLRQQGGLVAAPGLADLPPDPRRAPGSDAAARLASPAPEALAQSWQARLAEWHAAGIAGFRVLDPAWGGDFWARQIATLPQAAFLAWTPGVPAEALPALRQAGFACVASSLPWWDFGAGWWAEEAERLSGVAPLLMAPEAPFGQRLAARHSDRAIAARAARRALRFAALSGSAWLMPMGFEYGALHRAGQGAQEAAHFAALRQSPRIDLTDAVREANAERRALPRSLGAPRLLSAPRAPVALLRESEAGRVLLVANSSLARPARMSAGQLTGLLPRPGRLPKDALKDGALRLDRGEVRCMTIEDVTPITLPDLPVEAALEAARIAIEAVRPAVDEGRFPVKRAVGQAVRVTADIFTEGHGKLAARLLWRAADEEAWHEVPMLPVVNDIWAASFVPERIGRHVYGVIAWVDHFEAFRDEIAKKHKAGVPIALERREGVSHLEEALPRLTGAEAEELRALVARLADASDAEAVALFTAPRTRELMTEADARPFLARSEALPLDVERREAGFASWYEIFPRSQSGSTDRHGTFDDVIRALPRVRDMGFDVLYFPPIHPIGQKNRKGRNNSLTAGPDDPGSPYAIGSEAGGHDALHPELGTLEDFRRLVAAAREHGLELALDFAIQCSPDHPWLREHPEWFAWRPDGSIRYAENPPKKYEDIVNVEFYAEGAKPALWLALRDVVLFWVKEGVKLFRVDNPHTKPLPFWEWMIGEVRAKAPDAVFLSEAFTRPKVMYRLAKIGFSQSYTYFTWRNSAWEMREYLEELNRAPVADFFRPHFFVNTPDINPVFLQNSGRGGHLIRAGLAATLSGLWGVYNGFELCEARPVPGKEEYLDSEKYEIKVWDYERPGNITAEITMLNRIRRQNPALHTHLGTTFLRSNHDGILTYVKATPEGENIVLVAVSMDPNQPLETHFELPQTALGLPPGTGLLAEDLIHGGEEAWHGTHRHVRLDPHSTPFAIWRIRAADKA
ncbi:alpha-1,4-glucan--maltose-1-phosphate maltosyltransferase [Pseudoroseomonas cervicalis]|uniref:alpha-1,4-glucan--maltose-1-phosphate maltosyltransferase n=1 Tax=Teichococcus cervicalis TaxID=204525 RepID=UPI0022F18F38|nr:alpha-1,4-glucan--maltose-1-phosphate maltosyltransferase [Pseudoroseomonas cervicalis]WBV41944.1 alpha-1,4-glucan--maltose-1-phosphate maltosyltransferase [Pseudoroseomonas cervicalis]